MYVWVSCSLTWGPCFAGPGLCVTGPEPQCPAEPHCHTGCCLTRCFHVVFVQRRIFLLHLYTESCHMSSVVGWVSSSQIQKPQMLLPPGPPPQPHTHTLNSCPETPPTDFNVEHSAPPPRSPRTVYVSCTLTIYKLLLHTAKLFTLHSILLHPWSVICIYILYLLFTVFATFLHII